MCNPGGRSRSSLQPATPDERVHLVTATLNNCWCGGAFAAHGSGVSASLRLVKRRSFLSPAAVTTGGTHLSAVAECRRYTRQAETPSTAPKHAPDELDANKPRAERPRHLMLTAER